MKTGESKREMRTTNVRSRIVLALFCAIGLLSTQIILFYAPLASIALNNLPWLIVYVLLYAVSFVKIIRILSNYLASNTKVYSVPLWEKMTRTPFMLYGIATMCLVAGFDIYLASLRSSGNYEVAQLVPELILIKIIMLALIIAAIIVLYYFIGIKVLRAYELKTTKSRAKLVIEALCLHLALTLLLFVVVSVLSYALRLVIR